MGGGPYAAPQLSAAALAFHAADDGGWTKTLRGRAVRFAELRRLAELAAVERLQETVLGVGDRDLVPASELVVVAETGGAVVGAFIEDEAEPVGAVVGWGGYVQGVPRIVSDFLAVEARHRNLGLGAELKKLQAVLALTSGFREIVWTVDPLRAANARLNFAKLGATSRHYERNRYGEGYGAGLYGSLPSDRLHLVWAIASDRVADRLLHGPPPLDPGIAALPRYAPGRATRPALVEIPTDIDALLREDPAAARRWRFAVREALEDAFGRGRAIVGFVPDVAAGRAAYLIAPEPACGAVAP